MPVAAPFRFKAADAESASKWGCWVRGSLRLLWAPNICILHQRQGAAATRDHAAARET